MGHTLFQVLDVLRGQGDADAVDLWLGGKVSRLFLSDVSRHVSSPLLSGDLLDGQGLFFPWVCAVG